MKRSCARRACLDREIPYAMPHVLAILTSGAHPRRDRNRPAGGGEWPDGPKADDLTIQTAEPNRLRLLPAASQAPGAQARPTVSGGTRWATDRPRAWNVLLKALSWRYRRRGRCRCRCKVSWCETGIDPPSVHQNRAGAALAVITTLLGAGQIQMGAQHVEERGPWRDFELSFDAVDDHRYRHLVGYRKRIPASLRRASSRHRGYSARPRNVKSSILLNASRGRIFWLIFEPT